MAYQPLNVPEDSKDIPGFLRGELRRMMAATATPYLQLDVYHKAPDKPREGMIVCADGTDWDPGSGAGFYGFLGGAWVALIPPPAPSMSVKIVSQIFTSSGTFTPPASLVALGGGCFVRVIGGGGGGGGGSTSGTVGGDGSSSSIGGVTARGGSGGGGGPNPFGGIGRVNGSAGYNPNGGIGGDAGGPSAGPASVGAAAPSNSGAGGCGGGNNYSGNGGGGGGSGTVEESPLVITSATSVTVGAGGSGGSGGKAGGAGGSGKVMVWWYE